MTLRRLAHLLATFALVAMSPGCAAQTSEPPEAVAGRYIAALKAGDWMGMSRLMHPDALSQVRQLLAPLYESPSAEALRQQILGVKTVEEAKALSDTAAFAAILAAMTQQEGMAEALQTATAKTIGHVAEGADTVHVVYRLGMTVNGVTISQMDVFSLIRYESSWRGILKGDFSALAAMIRQAASQ